MKKLICEIITKLKYIDYTLVLVLWVVGAVLSILGFPWLTLGIVVMHLTELVTVGLKAGRAGGEGFLYSIVMCMMFGFTWWVPLKMKTNQFKF